jgi:predicted AlkP superfamily phosphohydrolase/phosphomutase
MVNFFSRNKKRKVMVLGVDGVPCTLLKDFINKGIMPNLSSLAKEGHLREMNASIPEVSSTSWTTFMTGVNPGRHGIYGFMDLKPNSYSLFFPNSNDMKSNTLWDILGKHNKRSIVLNVPATYPAKPLNGILTAGFVSLDLQKATYPESAYRYLKTINYRMDVDTQKAVQSQEVLVEDIQMTFQKRVESFLYFLDNEEWDLSICTITETDRLHHFLWAALEDVSHPQHGFFITFYKKLDSLIGEMYARCGEDTSFIIVSDHGFAGIKQEVYLNSWLREMGYLLFRKAPPGSLEDIHPESRIFVLDPSRLYINLKNRYPSGSVEDKDYEDIRLKIKQELLNITINSEKVIKEVFMREELYKGPLYESAPDLIALPHTGFDLKGALNKQTTYGRSIFTGAHTRGNATFFVNQPVKDGEINIVDVAPTILALMGIQHNDFDGIPFV